MESLTPPTRDTAVARSWRGEEGIEGGMEGGRDGGREGGREGGLILSLSPSPPLFPSSSLPLSLSPSLCASYIG